MPADPQKLSTNQSASTPPLFSLSALLAGNTVRVWGTERRAPRQAGSNVLFPYIAIAHGIISVTCSIQHAALLPRLCSYGYTNQALTILLIIISILLFYCF